MKLNTKSFICLTHQAWKVSPLIQIGLLLVAVLFLFSPWLIDSLPESFHAPCYLAGTILALGAITIEFSVRCPVCKAYWYFQAAKTLPYRNLKNWLNNQESCPVCGVKGDVAASTLHKSE